MFLSNILILSCLIMLYIIEENILVVICFSKKETLKSQFKESFKTNGKQRIIMP